VTPAQLQTAVDELGGQEKAAEALGVSRRMLNYYLSGKWSVPRTVELAVAGLTAQRSKARARKRASTKR
jgi:DNA-binding transcriptional regulator YdaS (Cro superfamily)